MTHRGLERTHGTHWRPGGSRLVDPTHCLQELGVATARSPAEQPSTMEPEARPRIGAGRESRGVLPHLRSSNVTEDGLRRCPKGIRCPGRRCRAAAFLRRGAPDLPASVGQRSTPWRRARRTCPSSSQEPTSNLRTITSPGRGRDRTTHSKSRTPCHLSQLRDSLATSASPNPLEA